MGATRTERLAIVLERELLTFPPAGVIQVHRLGSVVLVKYRGGDWLEVKVAPASDLAELMDNPANDRMLEAT